MVVGWGEWEGWGWVGGWGRFCGVGVLGLGSWELRPGMGGGWWV